MTSATATKAPRGLLLAAAVMACAALMSACAAATAPAETGRPRADGPPYPVVLTESQERRERALAGWAHVTGALPVRGGAAAVGPTPELQPVTATARSLPAGLQTPPRLPKVVIENEAEQSEEETRESLRRFIAAAAPLLGVEPARVSLVEITDAPGGAKRAAYRQSPFGFPLRNGYGLIEITFTPDLRVTGLTSTAVPDSDRLARSLEAVVRSVTAEAAVASLANRAVTFTGPAGERQTRTLTQSDPAEARELVVFPVERSGAVAALELHLAWEIAVGGGQGPPLLVYVDAVTGEQLAAVQSP